MQFVTLGDLNKTLPHALTEEIHRLNALEHNTLVKHRFTIGELSSIPNPESEHQFRSAAFKARFNTQIKKPLKKTGNLRATKRKHTHDNNTIADHHVHLTPDFYVCPSNQLKRV